MLRADFPLMHLRTLEAIAQEGRTAPAAALLGVTLGGLRYRVRRLEEAVGVALVERRGDALRLTAAGRTFAGESTRALSTFDSGLRTAIAVGGKLEVGIGYTLTAQDEILDAFAQEVESRFPNISLTLRRLWTSEVPRALSSGAVDIAFARHPPWSPDLRVELLWNTPICVSVPPDHRLADRTVIALHDLEGESIQVVPRELSPGAFDTVEALFLRAGIAVHFVSPDAMVSRSSSVEIDRCFVALGPRSPNGKVAAGLRQIPLADPAWLGLHMATTRSALDAGHIAALTAIARAMTQPC